MPTEIGFWMMLAAFAAAIFVLACGWAAAAGMRRHRARSGELPPLAAVEGRGLWRIGSSIYGPQDLPLMAFLVLVYTLPMWFDLFGYASAEPMGVELAGLVATIVLQVLLAALVIGFVAWRRHPVEWLGLRWGSWPLAVPIAIGVVGLTMVFLWGLQATGYVAWLRRVQGDDGLQEAVRAFQETDDPSMLVVMSLMALVVAPVTEEVLFRGYLYPAAKRFAGRGSAIVFSSLIFAIAHHNALALLPLLFLAVLLTLVYEWTGSIWTPIAAHMLFNGSTVTVQLLERSGMISSFAS